MTRTRRQVKLLVRNVAASRLRNATRDPQPSVGLLTHSDRRPRSCRPAPWQLLALLDGYTWPSTCSPRHGLAYTSNTRPRVYPRGTLRVTPATEAGIADHAWSIEEIVDLLRFEDAHK